MLLFFIAAVLILAACDDLSTPGTTIHPIGGPKMSCHIQRTFRGMLFLVAGLLAGTASCRGF